MPDHKPNVSTPSGAHLRTQARLDKIIPLMGGTAAMRDAGEHLLPRYAAESALNYDNRLQRNVLLNVYRKTVTNFVGKPFCKPIVFTEGFNEQILDYKDNVDRAGKSIDVFSREVFQTGLATGMSHILVDHPPAIPVELGASLFDDRAEDRRPYFVQILPENIIAAFSEIRNGREVLTHVRIREDIVERSGWEEVTRSRIRVLEIGAFFVYEFFADDDEWVLVESGEMAIDEIPLVTYYSDKEGLMESRPLLLDLADLNIAHWQSSSDQRNVLTVARFPMLAGSGISQEEVDQVFVGPQKFLLSEDKDAKYYYVEHTGKAIDAGKKDLDDLKAEMASQALEPLVQRQTGDITATARALDSMELQCALQSQVILFEDALNDAFRLMGKWLNIEDVGKVKINDDFGISIQDAADVDILLKARLAGELSSTAFLSELKRRNILTESFDIAADRELQQEELPLAIDPDQDGVPGIAAEQGDGGGEGGGADFSIPASAALRDSSGRFVDSTPGTN